LNIVDGRVMSSGMVCGDVRLPRTMSLDNSTSIYNILSTAAQLRISQKALGVLPEDGNVMPKHVKATLHN
jgi:hypothetical protein